MRRSPIVSVVELREVSTNSACELTSTTSFPAATVSPTGNSAIWPTVMLTSVASALAKPAASTMTVYVAGGSRCALYPPWPSPIALRSTPLATFCTVTVALTTRLPLGSFTVTCRSPVAAPCATANWGTRINKAAQQNKRKVAFIKLLGSSAFRGRRESKCSFLDQLRERQARFQSEYRWFVHQNRLFVQALR